MVLLWSWTQFGGPHLELAVKSLLEGSRETKDRKVLSRENYLKGRRQPGGADELFSAVERLFGESEMCFATCMSRTQTLKVTEKHVQAE